MVVPGLCVDGLAHESAGVERPLGPLSYGSGRVSTVSKVHMLMRTLLLATAVLGATATRASRGSKGLVRLLLLPLRALLLTEGRVLPLALDRADLVSAVVVLQVLSLVLFPVHDDGLTNTAKGDLLDGRTNSVILQARDVDLNDGVHVGWELSCP